jgi:23S rRNA (cytosine1962-C5)-methyltransferase
VDQSAEALSLLKENLSRNGWTSRGEIVEDDGFDVLNRRARSDQSYDFIVLDPPAFAKSNSRLDEAQRGYKEINMRSMRMLKDEGILATSSCSTPVSRKQFVKILRESASDAHTACRVLEERGQPPDHPWLTDVPATRYLKCFICEISLR